MGVYTVGTHVHCGPPMTGRYRPRIHVDSAVRFVRRKKTQNLTQFGRTRKRPPSLQPIVYLECTLRFYGTLRVERCPCFPVEPPVASTIRPHCPMFGSLGCGFSIFGGDFIFLVYVVVLHSTIHT
jgi:hypothetical protein